MKTSARNQFLGKVTACVRGAVNDEIEISLEGVQKIVATITHASTESLHLKTGVPAIALIKASSIILATDTAGVRFSARNQITGTVSAYQPGAVNSEVTLKLPGGSLLTAIITQESAQALHLKEGATATALFKASSVIVGVPA